MLDDILRLTTFVVGAALYGIVAWYAIGHRHRLALAVGSSAVALVLGYLQVGHLCSQGLSCDVAS